MIGSILRYSHFLLAITSALFLIIASVTGAILAFEPISQATKAYTISGLEHITLGQTVQALNNEYSEVLELEVTPYNTVKALIIDVNNTSNTIYINPLSGKKIGDYEKPSSVFSWVTNFHRSLFLKGIGRFFVGFVSLLLCLIAVTGLLLVVKRQGTISRLFSKVKESNFNEKYHVIFGRWFLIPILIIAVTGVYLSAEKFSLLPKSTAHHNFDFKPSNTSEIKDVIEFSILKKTTLDALRKFTFPFSDDAEDYFEIALKDGKLLVHQYTGDIISDIPYPFVQMASQFSLKLHTGQGSILWSLVLLLASLSMIFFIYSGLSMSFKRIKKSKVNLTLFDKDECEIVILVGSETGNTFEFAKVFCKALINAGKKVFIGTLNEYTTYKKATQLIVLTSTYGDGEAPNNARNFEQAINSFKPINNMLFSVVGFGSNLYPNYCHFAIKTDALLHKLNQFRPLLPLVKINNQSQSDFDTWVSQWSKNSKIGVQTKSTKQNVKQDNYQVIERTDLNVDDTFLLKLKPKKTLEIQSGDLLVLTPKNHSQNRLYSIAKVENQLVFSIKKHEKGVCSTTLSHLKKNEMIKASIQQNPAFHFPQEAKEVIMISNGTGIAPFLGMINNDNPNEIKTYLFWGGRNKKSFQLYSKLIDKAFYNQKLSGLFISFSKEENQRKYVQNSLVEKEKLICNAIKNKGVIMICGSLAMKNDVLKTLNAITLQNLNSPLSYFENNNQILTDCY